MKKPYKEEEWREMNTEVVKIARRFGVETIDVFYALYKLGKDEVFAKLTRDTK